MKKLLLVLLVIFVIVGGVFANGQFEGPRDGSKQQLQECYVDGEFNMDLFLENSPVVSRLDVDDDGIVDGTDVSIEDFILARSEEMPMGDRKPQSRGRQPRGRR